MRHGLELFISVRADCGIPGRQRVREGRAFVDALGGPHFADQGIINCWIEGTGARFGGRTGGGRGAPIPGFWGLHFVIFKWFWCTLVYIGLYNRIHWKNVKSRIRFDCKVSSARS